MRTLLTAIFVVPMVVHSQTVERVIYDKHFCHIRLQITTEVFANDSGVVRHRVGGAGEYGEKLVTLESDRSLTAWLGGVRQVASGRAVSSGMFVPGPHAMGCTLEVVNEDTPQTFYLYTSCPAPKDQSLRVCMTTTQINDYLRVMGEAAAFLRAHGRRSAS